MKVVILKEGNEIYTKFITNNSDVINCVSAKVITQIFSVITYQACLGKIENCCSLYEIPSPQNRIFFNQMIMIYKRWIGRHQVPLWVVLAGQACNKGLY